MAVAHDMFGATLGTMEALRPMRLTRKFETFRVIEQRRQIDQNTHGSNLLRISREPYGFSQLRSPKALHAESFRRTTHLRRRAVRFHHPGTRDEPPSKFGHPLQDDVSKTCLLINIVRRTSLCFTAGFPTQHLTFIYFGIDQKSEPEPL